MSASHMKSNRFSSISLGRHLGEYSLISATGLPSGSQHSAVHSPFSLRHSMSGGMHGGLWLRLCLTLLVALPFLLWQNAAHAQGYPSGYYDNGQGAYQQNPQEAYPSGGYPGGNPSEYAAPADSRDAYAPGQTGFGDGYVVGQGETGDYEDMSTFYGPMASYGDWFYTPTYGYVWCPWVDHRSWRPYVDNGYWVWSDYGWMWVSNYEWGWAAFHYGRWVWLDNSYWVWVPDSVWGPSWVAWRYTDEYVGWSPLPPGAYWYPDYGLEISVNIPVSWWIFAPGYRLIDVDVYRYVLPGTRTNRVYYASRPSTVYRVQGGVPVSVGVEVTRVRRWVGAPIRQVSISVSTTPVPYYGVSRGAVTIYRPTIARTSRRTMAAPPPPRNAAPDGLRYMAAPPPPARKGASSSQYYNHRASVSAPPPQGSTYRSAPPPSNSRTTAPTEYRTQPRDTRSNQDEIRRQQQDVQREKQDVRREQQDVRREQQDVREVRQSDPGNREAVQQERNDVRQERNDVNRERRDVNRERRDVSRERTEQSRERQEQRQDNRRSH